MTGNTTIGGTLGVTGIGGNLEVIGNLTVQGTQTILNTTTLDVEDNIVKLNKNVTGTPNANAGLEVERGDQTNSKIYWDESVDLWKIDGAGTVKTIAFDEELDTLRTNTGGDFNAVRVSINNFKSDTSDEFDAVRVSINNFKSDTADEFDDVADEFDDVRTSIYNQRNSLTDMINLRATIVSLEM